MGGDRPGEDSPRSCPSGKNGRKRRGARGSPSPRGCAFSPGPAWRARRALPAADAAREWLHADAGEWLRSILAGMRSPEGIAPVRSRVGPENDAPPLPADGGRLAPVHVRSGAGGLSRRRHGAGKDHPGPGPSPPSPATEDLRKSTPSSGPALLVVPASLVANWKAEIGRFAPSLATFYAHPSETPAASLARWRMQRGGRDALRDGPGHHHLCDGPPHGLAPGGCLGAPHPGRGAVRQESGGKADAGRKGASREKADHPHRDPAGKPPRRSLVPLRFPLSRSPGDGRRSSAATRNRAGDRRDNRLRGPARPRAPLHPAASENGPAASSPICRTRWRSRSSAR